MTRAVVLLMWWFMVVTNKDASVRTQGPFWSDELCGIVRGWVVKEAGATRISVSECWTDTRQR